MFRPHVPPGCRRLLHAKSWYKMQRVNGAILLAGSQAGFSSPFLKLGTLPVFTGRVHGP